MQESAEQGRTINPHLTIIKNENTNHFISLEQPETIQAIH
jgi:hypothetical protein